MSGFAAEQGIGLSIKIQPQGWYESTTDYYLVTTFRKIVNDEVNTPDSVLIKSLKLFVTSLHWYQE